MKNGKIKFLNRLTGLVIGGVIGLISFSGLAVQAKGNSDKQEETSIVTIETEKKSEKYYKTKTGKCYHKEGCSCLKNSKVEINEKEIEETNLRPCKKCCK